MRDYSCIFATVYLTLVTEYRLFRTLNCLHDSQMHNKLIHIYSFDRLTFPHSNSEPVCYKSFQLNSSIIEWHIILRTSIKVEHLTACLDPFKIAYLRCYLYQFQDLKI